jgi:hypothetical protein
MAGTKPEVSDAGLTNVATSGRIQSKVGIGIRDQVGDVNIIRLGYRPERIEITRCVVDMGRDGVGYEPHHIAGQEVDVGRLGLY